MTRRPRSSNAQVVDQMRSMILTGELLPGQHIRQEAMSARLGVSRLPVRQALEVLAMEGLVEYVQNAGYTVARLSEQEFEQLLLVNAILEDAILERLQAPDAEEAADLTRASAAVQAAADAGDFAAMRELNDEFHFLIFRLCRLDILVRELERVWTMTRPYFVLKFSNAETRARILAEHRLMLVAAIECDRPELLRLMEKHRDGGDRTIHNLLRRSNGDEGEHAVLRPDEALTDTRQTGS
jgi:DNA-binding GntR family transcriptional regulator